MEVWRHGGEPVAEGGDAGGDLLKGDFAAGLGGGNVERLADTLFEADEGNADGLVAEGGVGAGVEDLWDVRCV